METKSDNFGDGEQLEAKEYFSSRSGDAVEEDNNEEETEVIKRKISSHSLYDLLVDTHLDCLKVFILLYNPIYMNLLELFYYPIT